MTTPARASATPMIGIHLDLKYQMPRKDYLLQWVKRLPSLGIDTLLVEYEDKFPYETYPFLRAEGAFTPEQLTAFLDAARSAGLRVIPLLQTLAHLEFALAHEELAGLREAPDILYQICPSKPEAIEFVHGLLDEVLAFHDQDELFHLGADEAWSLGTCPACAEQVREKGAAGVWIEHTAAMCDYVRDRGKRPLVWDDTFWPNPELVRDFPADVILCTWHYGITTLKPESQAVKCMEVYRRENRDVIGVPCANWGVLFPRRHCIDNTAALAQLVRDYPSLGLINSAWSCFHLPLPVFLKEVAATAPLVRGEPVTPEWEQSWLDEEFGVRIEGLAHALHALGQLWEVRIQGMERPITPMVHGCMDMMLHYPDGHRGRMRNGGYPLDWGTIDFSAMYRKKLKLLRALPSDSSFRDDLATYLSAYEHAAPVVEALAERAVRRREEAQLFAALAVFKLEATRALSWLVLGEPDKATVATGVRACHAPLQQSLARFLEPPTVARFMRMWYEPVAAALREE